MKLTKFQLKTLKKSLDYYEKPPTFFATLKKLYLSPCGLKYLLIFGYSLFVWYGGWELIAAAFSGLGVGFVLKDIGYLRVSMKVWQINKEITDWDKVREIISDNET